MKSTVLVVLLLAAAAGYLYAAPNTTLEGTLVSSVCYLNGPHHPTTNDMGGKKKCGTYCLKGGDPAGLVTKDNEFHVLVASSITLAPYVGQQVRVTGSDHNGAIDVDKIEVSKNGGWTEINLRKKR
jgi:hypothetical protein